MIIDNKRSMYDLQLRLRLGNCLSVWHSIEEVRRSNYHGPIAIRSLIPGLGIVTHIDQNDLERATERYLISKKCSQEDILYSEMAAPSMGIDRLLNGQLTRTEQGLYLEYGDQNVHMNEAMRKPKIASMLKARSLLELHCDPNDHDDLIALLEEYEDPIVEFSILDKPVGWADRKMVIWEVRHY